MVVVVTLRIGAMVFLLADVELTPENRTNPMLLRSVKKMDRAIDVAVIGDRHRRLLELLRARRSAKWTTYPADVLPARPLPPVVVISGPAAL